MERVDQNLDSSLVVERLESERREVGVVESEKKKVVMETLSKHTNSAY